MQKDVTKKNADESLPPYVGVYLTCLKYKKKENESLINRNQRSKAGRVEQKDV